MATEPLTGLAEHLRGSADTLRNRPQTDATNIAVECLLQWAEEVAAAQAVPRRIAVWFGEWELILPQDARESFRELLAEIHARGVPGSAKTSDGDVAKDGKDAHADAADEFAHKHGRPPNFHEALALGHAPGMEGLKR